MVPMCKGLELGGLVIIRGMPWSKTGATHYHEQLGLLDKGHHAS